MAAVVQGSAGYRPPSLVSRSGDEQAQLARLDEVLEQAKLELSDRYGFRLDEAFEVLCALAKSQGCSIEEFADSVVRSDGRLDGVLEDSSASVLASANGSAAASIASEVSIEAPSAAAAFVLAGSLAEYGARAMLEHGVWRVAVDRCPSCSEGAPGVLSRTRRWMAECGVGRASVTLNGETHLLDSTADGSTTGTNGARPTAPSTSRQS
jgi:hypothetical protein